jgi:hypothetical protein
LNSDIVNLKVRTKTTELITLARAAMGRSAFQTPVVVENHGCELGRPGLELEMAGEGLKCGFLTNRVHFMSVAIAPCPWDGVLDSCAMRQEVTVSVETC